MAVRDERSASQSEYQEIQRQLNRLLDRTNGAQTFQPQSPLAVIDPTLNVKESIAREVAGIREIIDRDRTHNQEIRVIEQRCADELAELRQQLALKESERINAINLAETRRIDAARAEDKSNVALALAQADLKASNLAERVDASAKALSEQRGVKEQQGENRQGSQFITANALSVLGWVIAAAIGIYAILPHK